MKPSSSRRTHVVVFVIAIGVVLVVINTMYFNLTQSITSKNGSSGNNSGGSSNRSSFWHLDGDLEKRIGTAVVEKLNELTVPVRQVCSLVRIKRILRSYENMGSWGDNNDKSAILRDASKIEQKQYIVEVEIESDSNRPPGDSETVIIHAQVIGQSSGVSELQVQYLSRVIPPFSPPSHLVVCDEKLSLLCFCERVFEQPMVVGDTSAFLENEDKLRSATEPTLLLSQQTVPSAAQIAQAVVDPQINVTTALVLPATSEHSNKVVTTLSVDTVATAAPVFEGPSEKKYPVQDIWLAIHSSVDKAENLRAIRERWKGKMAVALLQAPGSDKIVIEDVMIQVVKPSHAARYPINQLRQVALDMVPPDDLVLALDVDFIPSDDLFSVLSSLSDYIHEHQSRSVFVIPAFESDEGMTPPRNRDELLACQKRQKCRGVLEKSYEWAHRATSLSKWYKAEQPYEIDWEWTFEPYIVAKRGCLPQYHQELQYYGNNKVAWIYHIAAWGARFEVIPHGFITHKMHPRNEWSHKERDMHKRKVTQIFNRFQIEVKKTNPPAGCYRTKQNKLLKL